MPGPIETQLRAKRDAGRKLLVPYLTGGLHGGEWVEVLRAIVDAGADAVEVGIPFSDPVMDGPVIQQASTQALAEGATPDSVLDGLAGLGDVGVPIVTMTYANVVFRPGPDRFAKDLVAAGVKGVILPDLPVDELDGWSTAADAAGLETILLAAPTTPDDRLATICARSQGWVYGVAVMGVTGERAALGGAATAMAARLKACTDKPVLMGVGVSTPEQAAAVATAADGVIVGSALVRRILAGEGAAGAASFVRNLRAALL